MEYAYMKYQSWKSKMICGSCNENNDVEIFLPCGHMLCQNCKDDIVKERKRACPFDRQRFTADGPKRVYWAAEPDQ